MRDVVRTAASNLAGWHETSLDALGLICRRNTLLWTCEVPGPVIYHRAITLAPGAQAMEEIEALASAGSGLSVCDSYRALDLSGLGFEIYEEDEWYVHPPGAPEGITPPELLIAEVTTDEELRAFEVASIDGFESPSLHALGPFGLHAPGILGDPRMRTFVGSAGDEVVSVSMAWVGDEIVGVYGVSTLPAHRRRGYGEALTWRALQCAPHLPGVLQPSEAGAALYRRMGFVPVGPYRVWLRRQ